MIDPHVLSLTHGVIEMEQLSPDYGTSRRRLRVSKLRAVKFREGYHDYIIATGGLRVFPRMIAAEHHTKFRHGPVSSGIKELDVCAVVGWIEGQPPSSSDRRALANLLWLCSTLSQMAIKVNAR